MATQDIGWAAVDVPDDWEDRRSVQFVSPPQVVGDARLQATAGQRVAGPRRSFIVHVGDKGALSLDDYATQQLAVLQATIPDLLVKGRPQRQHPQYGVCPSLDLIVQADTEHATRQALIFIAGDKVVATLTHTSRPDDKSADGELKAMFESFAWK